MFLFVVITYEFKHLGLVSVSKKGLVYIPATILRIELDKAVKCN